MSTKRGRGREESTERRSDSEGERREGSRLERPSGRCDGVVARISSLSELGESRRGKSRRVLKHAKREREERIVGFSDTG